MTVIPDAPHLGRWLIPLLAGLGVLGLFWYLSTGNPPAPVVATPAVQPSVPAVPLMPARLTLSNDDGVITYAGTVHDEFDSIVDHRLVKERVRCRQSQG